MGNTDARLPLRRENTPNVLALTALVVRPGLPPWSSARLRRRPWPHAVQANTAPPVRSAPFVRARRLDGFRGERRGH